MLLLVCLLLVWVVARARAMVAGRPPLGYIDIPSWSLNPGCRCCGHEHPDIPCSVSTRSSLSSGAAGDIGDLMNDYVLLPEMYLEQKQQQVGFFILTSIITGIQTSCLSIKIALVSKDL